MDLRILVVDDEPVVRSLLRAVLEPAGMHVLESGDGNEAIEAAWRERPDVVLLDIGLPLLNGIDVCRALKTNPNPPRVLLISGNAAEVDLAGCNADGIIGKPFRREDLLRRIESALSDSSVA